MNKQELKDALVAYYTEEAELKDSIKQTLEDAKKDMEDSEIKAIATAAKKYVQGKLESTLEANEYFSSVVEDLKWS